MTERIRTMIVVCTDFWDGEKTDLQIQLKVTGDEPQVIEVRTKASVPHTGGDLSAWGSQVLRAALEEL